MATQKFLDQNGLQTFWAKIKAAIASSVSTLQSNAVLKTGDHTMAGKLTAQGGFAGNLTGKADTAGTADKTKASLSIVVKKADGTSATYTFNGSSAATATVDMSALATDAELEAAVEALGAEIDARIASVTADGTLITANTSTSKAVTIGPTNKLTTAVGLAEAAVRSVTDGSTNGYITVNTGGTSKNIQVADFSSYVTNTTLNNKVNGLSASIDANSQEIAGIKNAISGGTHFIGISTTPITDGGTEKPTIGGSQKTAANGDIVIYGNKEFIWNGTAWEELGDTTAEANRITALETLTANHTSLIAGVSGTVNSLSGTVDTINKNYASKAAAVGSISTSSTVSSGATVSIAATGNITTWTITPKNVNGTALTTAKITIESIPDSWINALS